MNSIASVLNIQRVFKGLSTSEDTSSGFCNDELSNEIANIYSARCKSAVDEAIAIASSDAQFVMKHVRNSISTTNAKSFNEEEDNSSNSTNSSRSIVVHQDHQKISTGRSPEKKRRRFFRSTFLSSNNRNGRTRNTHPNE